MAFVFPDKAEPGIRLCFLSRHAWLIRYIGPEPTSRSIDLLLLLLKFSTKTTIFFHLPVLAGSHPDRRNMWELMVIVCTFHASTFLDVKLMFSLPSTHKTCTAKLRVTTSLTYSQQHDLVPESSAEFLIFLSTDRRKIGVLNLPRKVEDAPCLSLFCFLLLIMALHKRMAYCIRERPRSVFSIIAKKTHNWANPNWQAVWHEGRKLAHVIPKLNHHRTCA